MAAAPVRACVWLCVPLRGCVCPSVHVHPLLPRGRPPLRLHIEAQHPFPLRRRLLTLHPFREVSAARPHREAGRLCFLHTWEAVRRERLAADGSVASTEASVPLSS